MKAHAAYIILIIIVTDSNNVWFEACDDWISDRFQNTINIFNGVSRKALQIEISLWKLVALFPDRI